MMASSAALRVSRWITVVVSTGQHRATGAVVCVGNVGVRGISTLSAGKLWQGGNRLCGGAGKAVTLKGLSGESSVSHMALARLSYCVFYAVKDN